LDLIIPFSVSKFIELKELPGAPSGAGEHWKLAEDKGRAKLHYSLHATPPNPLLGF
jgi:hypothetical protein